MSLSPVLVTYPASGKTSYSGHIGLGDSARCAMSATGEAETASEKPSGENFNDEMKVSKFRLDFS